MACITASTPVTKRSSGRAYGVLLSLLALPFVIIHALIHIEDFNDDPD